MIDNLFLLVFTWKFSSTSWHLSKNKYYVHRACSNSWFPNIWIRSESYHQLYSIWCELCFEIQHWTNLHTAPSNPHISHNFHHLIPQIATWMDLHLDNNLDENGTILELEWMLLLRETGTKRWKEMRHDYCATHCCVQRWRLCQASMQEYWMLHGQNHLECWLPEWQILRSWDKFNILKTIW